MTRRTSLESLLEKSGTRSVSMTRTAFAAPVKTSGWTTHASGGTLNMMRVLTNEDEANVYMYWEHYCEEDGSPAWRVSVRALKKIEPFEELTRYSEQTEQAYLYQGLASARRGFTSSPRRRLSPGAELCAVCLTYQTPPLESISGQFCRKKSLA